MTELSWPGVRCCIEALRVPRPRRAARNALARVGGVQTSTAEKYLSAAERLGLVVSGPGELVRLAGNAAAPEDLLLMSTPIRLFRRWQQIEPHPFRGIRDAKVSLGDLWTRGISLLHTADDLARHAPRIPEDLPPDAGLLLELARLWGQAHTRLNENLVWRTPDALDLFRSVLFASAPELRHEVVITRFIRACISLYNGNFVRLGIVQYPYERNRPYERFRTDLGYIKSIFDPRPFEVPRNAEPVQERRKRVSSGR